MNVLVLHIVDRSSGGVPVAAATYIANSPPGVRHAVCVPLRAGEPPAAFDASDDVEFFDLGSTSPVRYWRRVRALARTLRPSIVHAHSSVPGVVTRVSLSSRRVPIIYSPHGFAFERTTSSTMSRFAVRAIETLLGLNTTLIAACGRGELSVARRVGRFARGVDWVPNTASIDNFAGRYSSGFDDGAAVRVSMLGRVSPQKDPAYFRTTIDRMRRYGVAVEATWIGGSEAPDEPLPAALSGIVVSGWLARNDVAKALAATDLYVHSAAWEGFPIAVLDAHSAGCAILVRNISAFEGIDPLLTVEGGLDLFLEAVGGGAYLQWAQDNRSRWDEYVREQDVDHQRAALTRIWGPSGSDRERGARSGEA
ncbi:glycosyltransferase [Microbacterium sp. No. 7]|uniref:glycosyltransferase n=1 Tax=Microbacterium sp. No. 7 TaxID=1714373 RepID=UPI0009E72992|nr:glycosyltransferase [Microbacterium sp. No. 7]